MAGRGSRREKPRDVQLSTAMSMILRHGASDMLASGIRPDGFCVVEELLEVKNLQDLACTREDVERVVSSCPKQRFQLALDEDDDDKWMVKLFGTALVCKDKDRSAEKLGQKIAGDTVRGHPDGEWLALTSEPGFLFLGRLDSKGDHRDEDGDVRLAKQPVSQVALIRATQGHSLGSVEEGRLLHPLTLGAADLPKACVHGSFKQHLADILQFGLLAGGACGQDTRRHVHFTAVDLDEDVAATSVPVSGLRNRCEIAFWIDLPAALADGVPFFTSRNGVLLSPGIDGVVAPKYILKVLDLQRKQWLEFEPSQAQDPSALANWRREKLRAAVLEQVDFYFGDANYPTDEFLRGLADADGWVSLAEVASFNKMKKMGGEDLSFVRECLHSSSVVELSADGSTLRRKAPFVPKPVSDTDVGGAACDSTPVAQQAECRM